MLRGRVTKLCSVVKNFPYSSSRITHIELPFIQSNENYDLIKTTLNVLRVNSSPFSPFDLFEKVFPNFFKNTFSAKT